MSAGAIGAGPHPSGNEGSFGYPAAVKRDGPGSSGPFVSVVVPSYNHARYVADAVGSALSQDLEQPYEVVVVDDGSDDGSRELLTRRFGDDPRVRLELRSNHGISATFNRGLELARGTWVGFCCSDDRWHPGHLRAALESLAANRPALVCFGRARIVDASGAVRDDVGLFGELSDPQPLAPLLLEGNRLCFSAALFQREAALAVGGFDPALEVLQDYDLWLKLLERGSASHLTDATVDFRWDGGNASGAGASLEKRRDLIRILEGALERSPLLARDADLRRGVEARLAVAHLRLSRRLSDREERGRHVRQAFAIDPSAPWRHALELLKLSLPLRRRAGR